MSGTCIHCELPVTAGADLCPTCTAAEYKCVGCGRLISGSEVLFLGEEVEPYCPDCAAYGAVPDVDAYGDDCGPPKPGTCLHLPSCRMLALAPQWYSLSRTEGEQAVREGILRPCKVCKPMEEG